MIELIISVCLLKDPNLCKDVHLNYVNQSVSLMQCMVGGQGEMARWHRAHPKWAIKRWRCGLADQRKVSI